MVLEVVQVLLSKEMKKLYIILLLGLFTHLAAAQDKPRKEYYIGHHLAGIQLSYLYLNVIGEYMYVFNPYARFMWLARGYAGVSLRGDSSPFGHLGGALAYGRKSRLFVGLGMNYNYGYEDAKVLAVDVGYLLLGRKHLYFGLQIRAFYDPFCKCYDDVYVPFHQQLDYNFLINLGWAF